jgi:hypothetical protein
MKQIPETFVANHDFVGKCEFSKVKQNGSTYLYVRKKLKSNTVWYEVFNAKKIRKGSLLPNGAIELEDRMQYPRANSFGRTAHCCKDLTVAEKKFVELVSKAYQEPEEIELDMPKKRGRKTIDFALELPPLNKEFTIKELVELNGQNQGVIYLRLQDKLREGIVAIAGHKRLASRGKPTIIYKKVK